MECKLCSNSYNSLNNVPRLLVFCGHSVCTSCLTNSVKDNQIICPECGKMNPIVNIDDMPKNLALINPNINSKTDTNSLELNMNSNLSSNAKNKRISDYSLGDIEMCKKHNQKYQAYCLYDKIPICLECILSDEHKKHEFISQDEAYSSQKEIYQNKFVELTKIIDTINISSRKISDFEKKICYKAQNRLNDIQKLFQSLELLIKNKCIDLCNNVTTILNKEMENYNKTKNDLEDQLLKAHGLKENLLEVDQESLIEMLLNVTKRDSFIKKVVKMPDEVKYNNAIKDIKLDSEIKSICTNITQTATTFIKQANLNEKKDSIATKNTETSDYINNNSACSLLNNLPTNESINNDKKIEISYGDDKGKLSMIDSIKNKRNMISGGNPVSKNGIMNINKTYDDCRDFGKKNNASSNTKTAKQINNTAKGNSINKVLKTAPSKENLHIDKDQKKVRARKSNRDTTSPLRNENLLLNQTENLKPKAQPKKNNPKDPINNSYAERRAEKKANNFKVTTHNIPNHLNNANNQVVTPRKSTITPSNNNKQGKLIDNFVAPEYKISYSPGSLNQEQKWAEIRKNHLDTPDLDIPNTQVNNNDSSDKNTKTCRKTNNIIIPTDKDIYPRKDIYSNSYVPQNNISLYSNNNPRKTASNSFTHDLNKARAYSKHKKNSSSRDRCNNLYSEPTIQNSDFSNTFISLANTEIDHIQISNLNQVKPNYTEFPQISNEIPNKTKNDTAAQYKNLNSYVNILNQKKSNQSPISNKLKTANNKMNSPIRNEIHTFGTQSVSDAKNHLSNKEKSGNENSTGKNNSRNNNFLSFNGSVKEDDPLFQEHLCDTGSINKFSSDPDRMNKVSSMNEIIPEFNHVETDPNVTVAINHNLEDSNFGSDLELRLDMNNESIQQTKVKEGVKNSNVKIESNSNRMEKRNVNEILNDLHEESRDTLEQIIKQDIKKNMQALATNCSKIGTNINLEGSNNASTNLSKTVSKKNLGIQIEPVEYSVSNVSNNKKMLYDGGLNDSELKSIHLGNFNFEALAPKDAAPKIYIIGGYSTDPSCKLKITKFDANASAMNYSKITNKNSLKLYENQDSYSLRVKCALIDYIDTDKCLLIGGKENGLRQSTMELYDSTNDKFIPINTILPSARSGCAAVRIAKMVYIVGGNDGEKILNEVLELDLSTFKIRPLRSMNTGRDELALTINEDESGFYAIGGFGGESHCCLKTVEKYDIKNNTWHCVQPMSQGRRALNAQTLPDGVYAIGGFDGDDYLSTVELYDEANDKWKTIASLTRKRCTMAAAKSIDNQYIYVFGGFETIPLDSVERYSVIRNEWKTIETMPQKRFMHSAIMLRK